MSFETLLDWPLFDYCISLSGFWWKIGFIHGEESTADVYHTNSPQRGFQETPVIHTEGNVPTPTIHSLSTDERRRVQKPNNINNKFLFEQAYDIYYWQSADES